jgi:hypothetical protein
MRPCRLLALVGIGTSIGSAIAFGVAMLWWAASWPA